ncbi:hypothetical protein FCU45_09395 [Sulfurimonas crateris]|uniref:Uncharacterized protein n=1 Tax=Sulfurimonas crateris TaxID=2574727 RepID=A0A4U2Z5A2_9BACT|nr:hypothetical protein [Sulfurimonas crateris]TKI68630.1 hypothetical protein FCU45_09395 [Sulfurimonas crateris]
MLQDIVLILVMSVPMLMFSVYPGIKLGDYLQEKYDLQEKQKRIVSVATTLIFAVTLSSLLHFM